MFKMLFVYALIIGAILSAPGVVTFSNELVEECLETDRTDKYELLYAPDNSVCSRKRLLYRWTLYQIADRYPNRSDWWVTIY